MIYLSIKIQHVIELGISLSATLISLWMLKKFFIAKFYCTEETEGTVLDNIKQESRTDDGTKTVYFCSYTYRIKNDKFTDITSVAQSTPYEIGSSLTIMYNPKNQKHHYVVESNYLTTMVIGSILFLVLGTIFTIIITLSFINN